MAESNERDFDRTALTIRCHRVWYTGQGAQSIPNGLVGLVGSDCLSLDLSHNELSSITTLKHFVHLQELILDNNCLRDLTSLPQMPALTTLCVNNNKLIDIEHALERIKDCCPQVRYVSLLGNPGCPDQLSDPTGTDEADYERYRCYAVHVLPTTLRFLDSRPISSRERKDAHDRGYLMKIVRVKAQETSLPNSEECQPDVAARKSLSSLLGRVAEAQDYTPLPGSSRGPLDHKSAYGKCRYRYSGKNSEGNRFIGNNDL